MAKRSVSEGVSARHAHPGVLRLFQADAAACHLGLALLSAQAADVGCRLKLRERLLVRVMTSTFYF